MGTNCHAWDQPLAIQGSRHKQLTQEHNQREVTRPPPNPWWRTSSRDRKGAQTMQTEKVRLIDAALFAASVNWLSIHQNAYFFMQLSYPGTGSPFPPACTMD